MTTYTLDLHYGSGEVTHVIERDRLVVSFAKTARTESVPFDTIREINLRQDMPGVYSIFVKPTQGKTLMIPSRHFRGIGRFDDRSVEYAAFVRELMTSAKAASSGVKITAGSSVLYFLGWFVLIAGVALTLAVVVASLSRGLPPIRMLFVLPVCFVVGLGFVRQGRAREIDPAAPPPDVLPA